MKKNALNIAGMVCSIAIIVLAVLQMSGIWENAINIFEPLLGVLMLIQAGTNWEKNRLVSLVSLGVAIFVFGVAGIMFFG